MAEISTSSLLSLNFFAVTPLVEAAAGGLRLSGTSQAIDTAIDATASANVVTQTGAKPASSPALVAFDARGRLVKLTLNTGTMLDLFV
jgi:hypothetical protein